MESEHERLVRLYRELGDDHLRDLADEPEDLTDDARLALSAEMRRRGFAPERTPDPREAIPVTPAFERESGFGAGIPGMFPSGALAVEQALEPGNTDSREGMTGLHVFYDGHDLTRACDALDDSDVDFAVEEKSGDALVGAPPSFEIWVATTDLDLAQRVLREKVGLFPLPELDEIGPDPTGRSVLGTFSTRAEAEEVAAVLSGAGIRPTLSEPDVEDEDSWWTVEVPAAELERGLELVSEKLPMEA